MMNLSRLVTADVFAVFTSDRATDTPFIHGIGQEFRFKLSILRQLCAMAFAHLLEPSSTQSIMGHDSACPSSSFVESIGIA
jgi:hypothetical protein